MVNYIEFIKNTVMKKIEETAENVAKQIGNFRPRTTTFGEVTAIPKGDPSQLGAINPL
jgi:hypothetical protein